MTATIVPFTKKSAPRSKFKSAEEGIELDPPSDEDLKGFINTLKFLALQSVSNTVSVDVTGDELNLKIEHHNHDQINDANGVISVTVFDILAGTEFVPQDQKKMIDQLRIAFDRLRLEEYEEEVQVVFLDGFDDEDKTNETE